MPQQFLLNRLAALGHIGSREQWSWDWGDRELSKPPIALPRYLASRRRYGELELQPILVPAGPGADPLDGSLSTEEEWGALSTGRYHITLHRRGQVDLLDAVAGAFALLREVADEESLLLIPLEAGDIPENRVLTSEALEALAYRRLPLHSAQVAPIVWFQSTQFNVIHKDDFLWRICDRLMRRVGHARAALYLRSAFEHVYLIQGPVDDHHASFEEMPSRIQEQVQLESSIQDCLKAAESLFGGMISRDDKKVANKLIEIGVDPSETVGFEREPYSRGTVLAKLLALRKARDSRAAHGTSAEERLNSLYELCDFQHMILTLLWRAIAAGDEALLAGQPMTIPLEIDESLLSESVRSGIPTTIRRRKHAS